MRVNILRHKCLFYDTTHLHSYVVIEKLKKLLKNSSTHKTYTGNLRVAIFTFLSRTL